MTTPHRLQVTSEEDGISVRQRTSLPDKDTDRRVEKEEGLTRSRRTDLRVYVTTFVNKRETHSGNVSLWYKNNRERNLKVTTRNSCKGYTTEK